MGGTPGAQRICQVSSAMALLMGRSGASGASEWSLMTGCETSWVCFMLSWACSVLSRTVLSSWSPLGAVCELLAVSGASRISGYGCVKAAAD